MSLSCVVQLLPKAHRCGGDLQSELPDDRLHPQHLPPHLEVPGMDGRAVGPRGHLENAASLVNSTSAPGMFIFMCGYSRLLVTHLVSWFVREMKICVLELKLLH